jgi:hypothetical protein
MQGSTILLLKPIGKILASCYVYPPFDEPEPARALGFIGPNLRLGARLRTHGGDRPMLSRGGGDGNILDGALGGSAALTDAATQGHAGVVPPVHPSALAGGNRSCSSCRTSRRLNRYRPLRRATTAVRRAPNGRRDTPGGRLARVRRPQAAQRRTAIWYSVSRTASGSSSTT